MSVEAPEPVPYLAPAPEFAIGGAAHLPYAAAPTLVFEGSAEDPSGLEIQSIALAVQVMIDPARRGYDERTRARLAELFGPPASWTPSTQGLAWARVSALVPAFTGSSAFTLEVPCTYDLEVAASKYFYAVHDGFVPLSFHFNGTIFYYGAEGRLQVVPVPWSATAQYSLPVSVWRGMMAMHYPGGGWIRVSDQTLEALNDRRAARGLPSFDACLEELLSDAR
jgi:Family of unknown function (DUF6084)